MSSPVRPDSTWFVSPRHTGADLWSGDFDTHVAIVEAQFHGWMFDQAKVLYSTLNPHRDQSTFAILTVTTPYFEAIRRVSHRVPTGRLAVLAQRTGSVFASATTWLRLVRRRGWRRPRLRVHPEQPRVGIRASRPNEIWHIDTTLIRLLDNSRVYLHAVIDNFSRRILAWRLAERFDAASSVAVLVEAGRGVDRSAAVPTLLADAGVENRNRAMDELIDSGLLKRVLAQTEIRFSNSMIESWWRSLKHNWLFLHPLDSAAKVRSLVAFYVAEHNARLPHSAFRGETPDEMYFGTGGGVPGRLAEQREAARRDRLAANRSRECAVCA